MAQSSRPLAACGAALGFLAVALGAFGAHGLEDRLSGASLGWWETATSYLLPHGVAVFALGLAQVNGLLRPAGWSLAAGATIFAGTLYGLALGGPSWLGAVTPVGGVLMLVGWAMAGWGALRTRNDQ